MTDKLQHKNYDNQYISAMKGGGWLQNLAFSCFFEVDWDPVRDFPLTYIIISQAIFLIILECSNSVLIYMGTQFVPRNDYSENTSKWLWHLFSCTSIRQKALEAALYPIKIDFAQLQTWPQNSCDLLQQDRAFLLCLTTWSHFLRCH